MEVICIDANFPPDTKAWWESKGCKLVEQDQIYTIRDVIKSSTGETALLLNEIHNPKVQVKDHPILGTAYFEPSFNIKRFRNIDMSNISAEQLNVLKQSKTVKNEN